MTYPEGVVSLSPGLLYSATLGNGRDANRNGVMAQSAYNAHPILRSVCVAVLEADLADGERRNPFRVGWSLAIFILAGRWPPERFLWTNRAVLGMVAS